MGGKSKRDKVRSAIEGKREIKKENRLGRERERERYHLENKTNDANIYEGG